ncbi:hypothetical protein [Demequina salsinemoris]|uniref:hypothetical protein n=1 Tax=Demequina salsinemoris TaxID=577470 RepID=UPI0007839C56|nr:hypothetical protein [Demequina salsinemoris]
MPYYRHEAFRFFVAAVATLTGVLMLTVTFVPSLAGIGSTLLIDLAAAFAIAIAALEIRQCLRDRSTSKNRTSRD